MAYLRRLSTVISTAPLRYIPACIRFFDQLPKGGRATNIKGSAKFYGGFNGLHR
jgi:hypothetical protein